MTTTMQPAKSAFASYQDAAITAVVNFAILTRNGKDPRITRTTIGRYTVPSSSTAGRLHHLTVSATGVRCTCPASGEWCWHRAAFKLSCKNRRMVQRQVHLRAYLLPGIAINPAQVSAVTA